MSVPFDLQLDDYLPLVERAVREDLGEGDITSAITADEGAGAFHLIAREAGVLCGGEIVEAVLARYDETIEIAWADIAQDGAWLTINEPLAEITGSKKKILAAERVALNFLQRLSGIASLTARYVEAVKGTRAEIYDTRKTTPGWRALEKYAVRCGGGRNHRMGLYDAILIKDNHLAGVPTGQLAGRIFEMLNAASSLPRPPDFVEVEVDTLEQLEAVFKIVGIDIVLLDNFTLEQTSRAVEMRDQAGLAGKVALEASGSVRLEAVRKIAEAGVDRIAVGALTHSAPALDIALEAESNRTGTARLT